MIWRFHKNVVPLQRDWETPKSVSLNTCSNVKKEVQMD